MTWIAGYADEITYFPGETVHVRTSSDAETMSVDLVRLIHSDTNPAGPGVDIRPIESVPRQTLPAVFQPVHRGSYGLVPSSASITGIGSFTVTAWLWPTFIERGETQGIVSTSDGSGGGFTLALDQTGRLMLSAGETEVVAPSPLKQRQWAFVTATYDQATDTGVVSHRSVEWPAHASAAEGLLAAGPSHSPLVFAAATAVDGVAKDCFDGKLEAPIVVGRVCSEKEIEAMSAGSQPRGALGAWAFEEMSTTTEIRDRSGYGHHGELFQMPARAMTGHGWDGASDVRTSPEQYGAVHFHSDDIENVGWELTTSIDLPQDLPSGAYAIRCETAGDTEHIVIFVAPGPDAEHPRPKVGMLFPTTSYMAYANDRMLDNPKLDAPGWLNLDIVRDRGDEMLLAHPEYGASIYDSHSDGSGIAYSSWLRPVLNLRPDHRNWQTHAPRAFSADLYIIHWLEQLKVAHDTLTDHLLHHEGAGLLRDYQVIITGTHPEYWTTPMRDALEVWLDEGGRLMYLGGNGFYWVTSVHPTQPHVVEVRRGFGGTRTWESYAGETRHSTTFEPGGLWRYRGQDPNRLVGTGFSAQGFDVPSPGYAIVEGARDSRAGWILEGVEEEVFGQYGLILDGACGDEIDRVETRWGTPPHAVVIASSQGHHTEFMQVTVEDIPVTHPNVRGDLSDDVRSDVVFMETGNGGAVFSASSMNWAGSLSHKSFDNDVARLTTNVLRRFMDETPFASSVEELGDPIVTVHQPPFGVQNRWADDGAPVVEAPA